MLRSCHCPSKMPGPNEFVQSCRKMGDLVDFVGASNCMPIPIHLCMWTVHVSTLMGCGSLAIDRTRLFYSGSVAQDGLAGDECSRPCDGQLGFQCVAANAVTLVCFLLVCQSLCLRIPSTNCVYSRVDHVYFFVYLSVAFQSLDESL